MSPKKFHLRPLLLYSLFKSSFRYLVHIYITYLILHPRLMSNDSFLISLMGTRDPARKQESAVGLFNESRGLPSFQSTEETAYCCGFYRALTIPQS